MQSPGNDPVASAVSGFCLMSGKPADRRLAALSAVENCIGEAVQNGTGRIRHISRATICTRSSKRTADPHRFTQLQCPLSTLPDSDFPTLARLASGG